MNNSQGFTLFETLIYLALFAVIIGGVVAAAYGIMESNGRNMTRIMMQEEASFLLGKLDWALTGAQNITVAGTPPQLSVNKYVNLIDNPLVFDMQSNKLRLSEGGGASQDLSSDAIQVTSLVFQDLPAHNGKPEGIIAKFELTSTTTNGMVLKQDFQTSKYLRR